ncbi:Phage terminase-like protein, large subunit, contains N-terminal HTH domain [Mesobacillus persicus]|uniref:Phage terminase-like protein, large subunit, contains N-terminal HTH domain n=1 Tax=Mesobacillus persicus TaxID=930146 RepID=A0A1H7XPG9_9BACI|nr:terminase TerL endonuclease subunit [Mesobacillus persicus]SEM35077.1 Phage terminase-like protein, large subunit, contains N-terminal HTH domain [Mesobacillus persicus]
MELIERIVNYCSDVIDGKIIACKKHIQAVRRFVNDLDKSQSEDFPYEFDTEEVYHFYEWAKMFKHTKGVLAGEPIELTDFQLFIVANIFGWKNKKTGYRRIRKVYIQIARKQAKSQLLSLIASYETFLSDEISETYIGGWSKDTSNIVYNEILSQIKASELLEGKFSDSYHQIKHLKSGSFIKALSREARRFGDGTNPSLAILDEYHLHPTSEVYEVLASGMVARKQPLIVIITTAGFNLSSPCYQEYQYVSKILDPDNPIENDEYFALICELDKGDDIKDETLWAKSCPISTTYEEGMNFLRGELKTALDQKSKLRGFLTKNMNIWVEMRDNGYMDLSKWKKCEDDYTLEDLRGLPCVVGVDLSTKNDLTSVTFLFVKDEHLYVHNHSFLPEETLPEKIQTGKVPYDLWIQEGWITSIPGAVVDFEFVEVYIEELAKQYDWNVREIISDPWQAMYFMQNMEKKGFVVVEARQGYATLSLPTKDFRERVYNGKVKHNSNPVLTWSISNAVVRSDANLNEQLDKSKSSEKIDPIASLINAHVRTFTLEGDYLDMNEHILSDDFSF